MEGPAGSTRKYKLLRIEQGRSAYTVAGSINKLNVIWRKWLIKECRLLTATPWADVEQPKTDKTRPRILTAAEEEHFFAWLRLRWDGWRLPELFLRVKGAIGCRLFELCTARTADLKDGRLHLESESCKGRKDR